MLKKNPARTEEYLSKYYKAKELVLNKRYSLTKASKIVGIDRRSLSNCLKEEGYEVVNYQNITKFNENMFDKIDTEEKAYWLGFLYADGYVESDENIIELSLKSSDIHHLEKFRDFLKFDKTKHIFKDNIRCRLSFRNKHMKQSLIKLGCTPRKSLAITFPSFEQVPDYLHKHFIRGYIDGDGSVMFNTEHTSGRLSILGTYNMLDGIVKATGWKRNKISQYQDENVYSVEWSGYYVSDYLDYLYKDALVYLDRKYDKYLQIKNMTNCRSKK